MGSIGTILPNNKVVTLEVVTLDLEIYASYPYR